MQIDGCEGTPLRGSAIIVHLLPRAYADLKGRLPPWANHKASLRDSRPKSQRKTIAVNRPIRVPACACPHADRRDRQA